MDSFEELGLSPLLVEALSAEGIERPTALQTQAIPLLRRGSSAVLVAAPGAGVLVAYGVPLLERIEPGDGHPSAIVVAAGRARATALALSLARLALGSGHRIGALGGGWARPEGADILFAALEDLRIAVSSATVKTEKVTALVLDGASTLLAEADRDGQAADALRAVTAEEPHVTIVSEKITPLVRQWVEEHARRAVYLPPEAAADDRLPVAPVERGRIGVRVLEEDHELALPLVAAELLASDREHVLLFCRSDDRAADLGDLLALHGFAVGRPGDPEAEIWLAVDPLEARAASAEVPRSLLAVVSADVPSDADELDRRYGGAEQAVALVDPHELPHLRSLGREAGYALEVLTEPPRGTDRATGFLSQVERALQEEDLLPYLSLLEPLIRRRGAAEVAAALAVMLRGRERSPARPTREPSSDRGPEASGLRRPPAWVRLFFSVGRRDGVATGDLLGAITGEAGIEGSQVGRIDLKDTLSLVEVQDSVAEKVMRSLNGTTIRGRSLRVDYDRGDRRARGGTPSRKRTPRGRRGGGSSDPP